ncbi:5844_t:CDS:1 [Cetraspora pellucida]|uniref:5844_t:CDS:1 n=1 Tax=Cetraspora pellucida TaxID=1433469 RepID=A0ACA9NPY7_9GLOM|nr:5844_t:CDS:1 [Cetraspora pellucida]
MKVVLIPLFLHTSNTCCDCQPGHSFKADWCLDLHGFLSREEFAARLDQINNHVKGVELMSAKTKYFLYSIASIGTILVTIVFIIIMPIIGFFISSGICSLLFFFAKYIIERNAAERAAQFTSLLNELFARYNVNESPTVNWKFWWVESYENYIKGLDGRAFGNGRINVLKLGFCLSIKFASLFTDNALIILEINDALSDLTANTVRVNIAYEANLPIANTSMVNMNYNESNLPISNTTMVNMNYNESNIA